MSTDNAGSLAPEVAPQRGFLQDLLDLYIAPREAFASLMSRRSSLWLALAIFVAVNSAGMAVWIQKVDKKELIRAQLEEYGVWDKIPAEKREEALDTSGFNRQAWLGVFVFGPLFLAALAGIYLFIFRFFFAGEVSYRQSFTVVSWAYLAVSLLKAPLGLVILALKGDWNIPPDMALQTSLALLLDKASVARPLWVVADSFDLFSFWTLWLLATGYAVASRRSTGSALTGALIPWIVYVLIKVGFAALFSR